MYQDGMTALMWASRAGHNAVIHRLIQAGASIDRKSGKVRT
jgi:ankyrin repeat protein